MWFDPIKSARDLLMEQPELEGITVTTTVPAPIDRKAPLPERFIRLMVTGERRRTIVHRDTVITVEVWNQRGEQAAAELMETVYRVIDDWDMTPTFDAWQGGPYLQYDPNHGVPRYVASFVVRHRTD